jgi:hypothetical protein
LWFWQEAGLSRECLVFYFGLTCALITLGARMHVFLSQVFGNVSRCASPTEEEIS